MIVRLRANLLGLLNRPYLKLGVICLQLVKLAIGCILLWQSPSISRILLCIDAGTKLMESTAKRGGER